MGFRWTILFHCAISDVEVYFAFFAHFPGHLKNYGPSYQKNCWPCKLLVVSSDVQSFQESHIGDGMP